MSYAVAVLAALLVLALLSLAYSLMSAPRGCNECGMTGELDEDGFCSFHRDVYGAREEGSRHDAESA